MGLNFIGSYCARSRAAVSRNRRICGSVWVAQRARKYSNKNISNPPNKLLSRLKVAAPRHIAKKKSFRSAPRIVRGRESERCTRLMRLGSAIRFSVGTVRNQLPGKSHARKFTAAMAIPTPKSTPASTRFDPPSPKAKVSRVTTIATSERPRAMVLVKAVSKTLTAFSQGELPPCANTGAARNRATVEARTARVERSRQETIFQRLFMSTPRQEFASQVAMRGKSTSPSHTAGRSRNALVRRHARLTPQESRPLRLDARSSQGVCRVSFPLFTYSVFGEKNVSLEIRNISRSWRRSRVVRRRGQTACVQLHCSWRSPSLRSAHVRASSPLGRDGKPKTLKDDTP